MYIIWAMAIRLVAFDLDGTLLDTLDDIRGAVNYALSAWEIPALDRNTMREYVGRGLRNALLRAVTESGVKVDDSDLPLMVDLMMNAYRRHPSSHTVPYSGIPELLKSILQEGVKIGILSNKSDELVKRIVKDILPDIPFSFVMGQSDQFPLKPNPESLYGAMETVGADRSEVIYVGDSEVDYELSENAGVKGIIVDYGFRTRKELEAKGISGTLSSVEALKEEIFRNFLKN